MDMEWFTVLLRLLVATIAGGLIGLERSYHGRLAGFRTHTLVCVASSLLMLVTMYQDQWFAGAALEIGRIDPTRMAQGVMTGIGFLGAGVIMKSGLDVRGLTTDLRLIQVRFPVTKGLQAALETNNPDFNTRFLFCFAHQSSDTAYRR